MTTETLSRANIPAHVPLDRVIDFDYFNFDLGQGDPHTVWKKLQDEAPRIFWTPRHGGHWVATRAMEMAEIEKDYTVFSHSGISIPRSSLPSLPLETDPPYHTGLRAIISPLFTPVTLAKADKLARQLMVDLTEKLAPVGHCEFITQVSQHLPIAIFLNLTGLPAEDAAYLLPIASRRVLEADPVKRDAVKEKLFDYLMQVIVQRRAHPSGDILSQIVHSKVDGRELSEFELLNMLATTMFGGLDTVASGLGFIMRYLAMNESARHWLRDQPTVPLSAVDELYRRHSIVCCARLLMRDVEFGDVEMKKGEQILVPTPLISLDDERFDEPMDVRFDRKSTAQAGTFGSGAHGCPGKNLGRMETKIALEEWLKRIPDFALDETKPAKFAMGITMSLTNLNLKWQPAA